MSGTPASAISCKAPPGAGAFNLINGRQVNQTAGRCVARSVVHVDGISNEAFDARVPEPNSVKVIRCGNVIEVFASDRFPFKGGKRLPDTDEDEVGVADLGDGTMVDLATGEIVDADGEPVDRAERDVDADADRSMSIRSFKQTQAALRRIINANCYDPRRIKWITLTYDQKRFGIVRDPERVLRDLREYHRRMRRYAAAHGFAVEYITVLEPQRSGAWHVHEILICTSGAMPFLDNNTTVARWWGKGFTTTKAVDNCDNLGAYLSAYLGDAEVEEGDAPDPKAVEVELTDPETGEKQKKKFVKGARIKYYPRGFHLYRCSRGIERPDERYINCRELEDLVSELGEPVYRASKLLTVTNTETGYVFDKAMTYMQFNIVRRGTADGACKRKRKDDMGSVRGGAPPGYVHVA